MKNVISENEKRKNKIRQTIEELKTSLQQGQSIYSDTYKNAEKTLSNYSSDLRKTSDSCKILSDRANVHKQLLKTLQDEYAGVEAARRDVFQEYERLRAQLTEEETIKNDLERKVRDGRAKIEAYNKETLNILDKIESIGVTGDKDGGRSSLQQQLIDTKKAYELKKEECDKAPALKSELEALKIEISNIKVKLFDISDEKGFETKIREELIDLERERQGLGAHLKKILSVFKTGDKSE